MRSRQPEYSNKLTKGMSISKERLEPRNAGSPVKVQKSELKPLATKDHD